MMAYLSLLLIAILTVTSGATPLYCSDVQSPASGSGHNTDLSQVTTLQYCIIDNCTIMRIDTGQQLDIVYTTESLLIVTPKDGHTSMVITKVDDELPCPQYVNTINDSQLLQYMPAIVSVFIMIASTYTLIVHLLFEKLRTLFGKLLIFYNICVVCLSGSVTAIMLVCYWIIVNSQATFHTTIIIHTLASTSSELFGANISSYLAYIMYCCYYAKSQISRLFN